MRTINVLASPRHTDQQTMPAGEQADQQQPDDFFLADDRLIEPLGNTDM
ncbi:MAG: hypothetical protein WDM80_04430 [Limisphaerales bacterium]